LDNFHEEKEIFREFRIGKCGKKQANGVVSKLASKQSQRAKKMARKGKTLRREKWSHLRIVKSCPLQGLRRLLNGLTLILLRCISFSISDRMFSDMAVFRFFLRM